MFSFGSSARGTLEPLDTAYVTQDRNSLQQCVATWGIRSGQLARRSSA